MSETQSHLDPQDYLPLIERAKEEDLGSGDITSQLLPASGRCECHLLARQAGVFAGKQIAEAVLHAYDSSLVIDWADGVDDGAEIAEPVPRILATTSGPKQAMLSAERVLLNFLQRLSGIATRTRAYVDAVAGTNAKIYDTRKTTPGWRALEKYAVRCGGGYNHRMGLYDAILIKDNHLAGVPVEKLAMTLFELLNNAGSLAPPPKFVEVEVDTLAQLEEVFKVIGIHVVLLDNFDADQLRRAVALRNKLGLQGKVELEASGGITMSNAVTTAQTGIDRISIGALTHSVSSLDLAIEMIDGP